jgi:PAS domain S-box-containing protein
MTLEGSLSDSHAYEMLVRSVVDYAIYMLDLEGRVVSWNAGAERIKGYAAGEIVGKPFDCFYTAEDRAEGLPELALAAARLDGRFSAEGWRVRKDGGRFWASVVIDPVYDDAHRLVGYAKITRDLTERMELQARLDEAREQLFQSQKLEAIGQLTGGVAHDFNNLLTVIKGSAEMLRDHDLPEARRARYVEAIAETADRAAKVTGQLLAFARRQPLNPEAVDLRTALIALRELMIPLLGSSIRLEIRAPRTAQAVEVDRIQFEAAMINLLINARDAVGGQGRIRVRTDGADRIPACGAEPDQRGDFVCVEVGDDGVGIPPEHIQRIFEPFFSTKGAGLGAGLGLSQVIGFARQSGGDIQVESSPGRGARFRLYLPAAKAEPPPAAARGPVAPPGEALRVLLVEDNDVVGAFARIALEEIGFRPVLVQNAAAALELLAAGETFDVVFSDVVMAGMDGVELGRRIRRDHPTVPVVLASGYSHVLSQEHDHGFELLRKPYSMETLSTALRTAAARAGSG